MKQRKKEDTVNARTRFLLLFYYKSQVDEY